MSDRITIDHMSNNIIIHVGTRDLSQMNNHEILEWVRSFTEKLEATSFQNGVVGEVKAPSKRPLAATDMDAFLGRHYD